MDQPSKKRKRSKDDGDDNIRELPDSLTAPISPPQLTRPVARASEPVPASAAIVPSPFKLSWIQDLPEALNVDAITLIDIIGDPLVKELWSFNYLTDVDFLIAALDEDVRELVKVTVVHGFWKHDDSAGIKLQASSYPNVTLKAAYMPFPFGTHHQKSFCILRHDDTAQIVIHTANIIAQDWRNLSQAVWMSPRLRLLDPTDVQESGLKNPPIGSGERFKIDYLNFLRAYDKQRQICKPLVDALALYDFSEIRGALIGSVPGNHDLEGSQTTFGWAALRRVLSTIPAQAGSPEVVVQISSIATLGRTDEWLDGTFIKALSNTSSPQVVKPKVKIIFPTADEIRRSLDGYNSGRSIHMKIHSPAQASQLGYLRPRLHHWAGDGAQHPASNTEIQDAGRKRAAPHIKTYVRYSSPTRIDWALVTSANLSKQAHGETVKPAGDVRICSYELGVLVWPELWGKDAIMVPTFKKDMPDPDASTNGKTIVGFRMPYDLPLVKYAANDNPWCATASYHEPDWTGKTWRE